MIKFVSDKSVGFFPGIPVSYTNKTDHHDITEILLKVALNTTILTLYTGTCLLVVNIEDISLSLI